MTAMHVRHTLRLFAKDPVFFFTVTVIMALGIGCCTAVFSLVEAVLLTNLPYATPERLAIVWHTNANSAEVIGLWPPDYQTYRDSARTFQSMAAFTTRGYNLNNGSVASRITCARVTSNLLPMLGVTPLRGRWFTDEEDRDGANRVVILSNDLWRTHFGSDESVLGKTIRLDLKPYTVVGIMPSSFAFPPEGVRNASAGECWIPAGFSASEMAMPAFNWIALGSLKPDVTIQQAQQDASAIAQRILESYPDAVKKEVALRARVVGLQDEVTARNRTALLVFAAAVALLLLIGCANVANLVLAKLHIRQREIDIRAALGATRLTLTTQILIESLALAGCGGLLGIPVAFGMLKLLVAFSPGNIPMLDAIRIDTSALAFTVACSVISGLLFGFAPALRARQVITGVVRHSRLRSALAVVEIAMAFVLLIGAGLLLRSFVTLINVPPGFDPSNVLTFAVALPEETYKQARQVSGFVDGVLERLRAINGVALASAGTSLPIGATEATVFSRVGAPPAVAGFKPAYIQMVTPDYLQTLRIPLTRGRLFEAGDDVSRPAVAVVNESMAKRYWPEKEVIGQQLYWLVGGRNLTVVGVVADVLQEGLSAAATPTFYVPVAQSPLATRNLFFAIRTARPAATLAVEVRRAVGEIDPALPVFSLQSAEDVVSNSVGTERFNMFLVTAFALCALVLSVMGIYAVISYLVIQSSREFGVRIALGATPGRILNLVLARGMKFVLGGIVIGGAGAVILTGFMKSMLFGISETDPMTFVVVTALVSAVSLLALVVPAIRAVRVNPASTLITI